MAAGPHGRFEIVLLHWGSLADGARAAVAYDNFRAGEAEAPGFDPAVGPHPQRAWLNNLARHRLMNRCLIDAVVYLGAAGDPIRHWMRVALCEALGGTAGRTHDGAPGSVGSRMDCGRGAGVAPVATFLLPESLGSAILFDALVALSCNAGIRQALSEVRAIYLLANQVPLLAQSRNAAPCAPGASFRVQGLAPGPGGAATLGALGAFLDAYAPDPADRSLRGQAGAGLSREPAPVVHLVAVTDPNDVLGYRLHPGAVHADYAVSNVLVSNAATLMGVASNPYTAHTNMDRDQITRLLLHGHPPATP